MPCKDCYNGCPEIISDQCVKYTGPDIELFGICTGDTISIVLADIIDKITNILSGTGITLSSVTFSNAPWLATLFGTKDKTLQNLFQLLIDSQQTLKDLYESLKQTAASFDVGCLTGLPANPNRDQVVQAILNKLCSLNTTVNGLSSVYVKITDLPTLVKTITTQGTNGQPKQYKDYTIPYTAFPYHGPLSNFDSTGKGLVGAGFDRIFICNGLNGTPDYRGRSPIGAVRNVPGPTPDNTVNPNHPLNAKTNVNYAVGEKAGTNAHKLTVQELPSHTHTINDPGHEHDLPRDGMGGNTNMWSLVDSKYDDEAYSSNPASGKSKTGITINGAGGSESHYNVHPVIGAIFIMYRP
jgi:hypothetical protein